MIKVITRKVTSQPFKEIVTPKSVFTGQQNVELNPITVYWKVDPQYFEIKVSYLEEININEDGSLKETPTYEPKIHFWHKVPMSALTAKPGFSDQSVWNVKYGDMFSQYVINTDGTYSPMEVAPTQLHDHFAETYINKGNYQSKLTSDILYQIRVPAIEGDMTDFAYVVMLDGTEYSGSYIPYVIDSASIPATASEPSGGLPVDPITVTGPETATAGSTVTVNVSTTAGVGFVYLEQVHGMLPRVKIPLNPQGQGSFNVLTTGMETGDEIEVKVGFKKWTNVTTYTKTLS
jgi:hypothetical protein